MINDFLVIFVVAEAYFFTKNIVWNVLKNKPVDLNHVSVSTGFLIGVDVYAFYSAGMEAMIFTLKLEIALIFFIAGVLSFLDCSKNTKMLREAEICFGVSSLIFAVLSQCISARIIVLNSAFLEIVFPMLFLFCVLCSGGFIFVNSRNK